MFVVLGGKWRPLNAEIEVDGKRRSSESRLGLSRRERSPELSFRLGDLQPLPEFSEHEVALSDLGEAIIQEGLGEAEVARADCRLGASQADALVGGGLRRQSLQEGRERIGSLFLLHPYHDL